MSRDFLNKARRVVVKAGTRSLLDDGQKPDLGTIRRLLEEIVALRSEGRSVIFVTSGAIGTGLGPLGFAKRPDSIEELQAQEAALEQQTQEQHHQDQRQALRRQDGPFGLLAFRDGSQLPRQSNFFGN